jgi:hypothetical protein
MAIQISRTRARKKVLKRMEEDGPQFTLISKCKLIQSRPLPSRFSCCTSAPNDTKCLCFESARGISSSGLAPAFCQQGDAKEMLPLWISPHPVRRPGGHPPGISNVIIVTGREDGHRGSPTSASS